ncbi:MAG: SH3 domain-containing protein, partial [Lachnospiraceae bacterium]|nr:SH3 domain-containing protein [Lachnospiraceae bacterium]
MNLKKLFINASVLLAGTALAVLIPVKAQAAGLISGGASRELNSSSSTLSETVGSSTTRTVTVQITEPSEVIEEEYLNLSIALFSTNPKYCNVRSGPGTEYSIVGRMYDGSVGSIIDEADETIADDEDPDDDNDQWIRIRSGAVEGYVLNSFLVTGVNAYNRLEEQTQYYAEILVSQLNVRKEASIDSSCLTYVTRGERYRIVMDNGTDPRVYLAAREVEAGDEELEDDGMDWVKIVYAEGKTGYVSADYITITEEYKTAKTIEEIREEEEAERERNLRATTS